MTSNQRHYTKVIRKILQGKYSYPKLRLLLTYLILLIRSAFYHKVAARRSDKVTSRPLSARVMGNTIRFFSFPQLINLVEEIYVYQVYQHVCSTQNACIFDGGGNIGLAALYLHRLNPSARIVTFEPDKNTFETLKFNVESNGIRNITVFNVALGEKEGEARLYKKSTRPGSLNMSLVDSSQHDLSDIVPTIRLSNLINENVDLLKLDIEGAEVMVIDDLIQSGKIADIKNMIIEYHKGMTDLSVDEFMRRISDLDFICEADRTSINDGSNDVMIRCRNRRFLS